MIEERLLLVLRDGRKLIGVLRSWDQFANLVLTSTTERYFVTSPLFLLRCWLRAHETLR